MRYLLGKLSEQETAEFEARCFDDDDLFHETADLESDLVHSYLRGELSEAERREFETGYLISPARRRKLEFARALENRLFGTADAHPPAESRALTAARPPQIDFAIQSRWGRLVVGAVAAAVITAISWLAFVNYRLNSELGQMRAGQMELRREQQALEAKLAALTSRLEEINPDSHGQQQLPQPETLAFNLTPGLPRSAGTIKQLVVPPGTTRIELNIYLEEDKYPGYRASLEATGGRQMLRKSGLKRHTDSQGHPFVSFEIPSDLLSRGDYLIKLDGVAGAREVEENIGAYRFFVARR